MSHAGPWTKYPNNHPYHLKCDLDEIKAKVTETLNWIMAANTSVSEKISLLNEVKDGLKGLVNDRNQAYYPGIWQLRNALVYELFLQEWNSYDRRGVWKEEDNQDWDPDGWRNGRNWHCAYMMTTTCHLNLTQIKKIVIEEAHRRKQATAQAVRETEKRRAEAAGLPRPVREIET